MASFHAILLACYAVIGCQARRDLRAVVYRQSKLKAKVRAVISVDLARPLVRSVPCAVTVPELSCLVRGFTPVSRLRLQRQLWLLHISYTSPMCRHRPCGFYHRFYAAALCLASEVLALASGFGLSRNWQLGEVGPKGGGTPSPSHGSCFRASFLKDQMLVI